MVRGQGVTDDPYFTRLRSKFDFHVSCRMKVEKVIKFGFITQILANWSASGASSNFFRSGSGSALFFWKRIGSPERGPFSDQERERLML